MGYPAQISGAEDDPVMSAIRAKFAQQQQQPATGMPTDILPQHIRAAAQAAVLSKNSNAKNTALNAQIAAMQSDPAIMQQIMETYGPDMAAQYAGGGNGNVQQPQAIQRAVPSAAETPVEEAAEGLSSSPAEEDAEANAPVDAGMPTRTAPVAQGAAPAGMDPALAAALGIGGTVAGGAAGYMLAKRGQRPAAAPNPNVYTMRQAVDGDFEDLRLPPDPHANDPWPNGVMDNGEPAPDPRMQAAVMGTQPPADPYAEDFRARNDVGVDDPNDLYNKNMPMGHEYMEPEQAAAMRRMNESEDNLLNATAEPKQPTSKRHWGNKKDMDAQDAHMRSIIMEMQGADTTPEAANAGQAQTAADNISQEQPAAPAKGKGKRTKKAASAETPTEGATADAKPAKAKRTNGKRTASATPNAEGGTDFVHTDAKTAKAAIAASKAKKEQSLAEKVDTVAAESAAPAEKPKKTRTKKADKPVTRTLDQSKALAKDDAHKARIQATRDAQAGEENAPKLIKKNASRLDQSTAPGTPAGPAMTLAEAKGIVSENPSDAILEKFNTEDPAEWDAIRKRAGDLIRASKAAKGTPEKKRALPPVEQYRSLPDAPDAAKGVYTGDDAVMNALRNLPVVENAKPKRKMLTPAEATARLLAKRAR